MPNGMIAHSTKAVSAGHASRIGRLKYGPMGSEVVRGSYEAHRGGKKQSFSRTTGEKKARAYTKERGFYSPKLHGEKAVREASKRFMAAGRRVGRKRGRKEQKKTG